MDQDETVTVQLLAERNDMAFEKVFKAYFQNLHSYACTIVKDEAVAEEMVKNLFFKIWEKTGDLNFSGSIAAYLYRAVYNESLNFLKHEKVKSAYRLHHSYQMKGQTDNASKKVLHSELLTNLRRALNELPEQCRTIFQMSRFDELKYREIAD